MLKFFEVPKAHKILLKTLSKPLNIRVRRTEDLPAEVAQNVSSILC